MGSHDYFDAEGHKTPSVSQIPGIFAHNMDGFEDWICSQLHGRDKSRCCTQSKRAFYQESANLGHDIHNLREAWLKGAKFEDGVPQYQAQVFEPVANFYRLSGYKPLQIGVSEGYNIQATELKMTGKEFGGTLDGAGIFDKPFWLAQRKTFWAKESRKEMWLSDPPALPQPGEVWIEDLKIKSKLDVLHPLQLYGYSLLLKEVYNVEAKWGLIIRREKNLEKSPEIQLRGYWLPAYKEQWDASMLMWRFLND